ncbi:MAG TPA: transketolase, partial [Cytophagales bacterium]|nr:transketolase [Cytophagales bacterium]
LDINRLAQSGETMFGHHIEKYVSRFQSFGFEVAAIDGHNFEEIDKAFEHAVNNKSGKPFAIVAKTYKGKDISFLENKDDWHGKALKTGDLQKALEEIGHVNDDLKFNFKRPVQVKLPENKNDEIQVGFSFDKNKAYATREIFGQVICKLGEKNTSIYALDGDVKNSTFTLEFLEAFPDRFVECFIAEQNMVTVAASLARLGKIPFVATFAAFLTRAADQIRMARVSEANIKFIGSHVGVSIGEDGPSQMGLEDIALFGALPDSVVLQPSDAVSTSALVPLMVSHQGFVYMRTLRPKTPVLYNETHKFKIGGSEILRQSKDDLLTIVASGITVFEALKAADELKKLGINVRVLDCYSICPVDEEALVNCLQETKKQILISVEDHFVHGGLGDFAMAAVADKSVYVEKMGVTHISQSGTMEQLLHDAGIDASSIVDKVKKMVN